MNTPENLPQHAEIRPKSFALRFMNAIMNPLMALILRSPLHGLMSKSVMLITVRGRKSGKAYTLPVQYAQAGEAIYIVPSMPESKTWWRNLRGGAPVILWLRGNKLDAQAEVLMGEANGAAIIDALKVYFQSYPASAPLMNIQRAADGGFDTRDLQSAASRVVVVRVMAH